MQTILLFLISIPILMFLSLQMIYFFTWFFTNPPSIPTDKKSRNAIMKLIEEYAQSHNKKQLTVMDLGCGFGHIIFDASTKFPNYQIVGCDHLFLPYLCCKIKSFLSRRKNVSVLRKDMFKIPLYDVDIVICFLFEGTNEKLKSKFVQELSDDAIIITNNYEVPGWEPAKRVYVRDLFTNRTVYLYNDVKHKKAA